MPSFDFDAARRERIAGYDPVEFTLGGQHFVARPAIPFSVIAEHLADDRKLNELQAYEITVAFIRGCLLEADHERFTAALADLEHPVDRDEPLKVVAYLIGCYVNRPTKPSADSSAGRDGNGGGSKAKRTVSSTTRGKPRRGGSSTGSKVA